MKLKQYTNEIRGRAAHLGRVIAVPPELISQWANAVRQIPAERCLQIEKATSGAVTCEDLRPDIDWGYLRQTTVHKAGS